MKKLNKKLITYKRYSELEDTQTNDNMLDTLENAWNNLPSDMTLDEREVFFEIAQNLVRLHEKVKIQNKDIDNLEKN